jgi:putative SOS response-associated peptidase YedK
MCGRYTVTSSPRALRDLFGYLEPANFPARYNIAPSQPIAVVRLHEGNRQFALVRWGLIPAWVKDPRTVSLMFNARGESVSDKPAFRNAMKRRRCLVPADGFYEWQKQGGGKQPFFIRARSGAPLAFAGLWETWIGPNGEEVDTAAIVTTAANETLKPLHDRMPVIVPPEAFDLWLAGEAAAERAASLIEPAPDDLLEAWPVSPAVNSAANDDPGLIAPASELPGSIEKPKFKPKKRPSASDAQGSLF